MGTGSGPAAPNWAERLLGWLVPPEEREVVLGDFLEEFRRRAAETGDRAAALGYWRELAASTPYFLRRRMEWRDMAMDTKSGVRQALLGLLLALPALLLVIAGVLQSGGVLSEPAAQRLLDPRSGTLRGLFHPALILGGLLLGLALNARPVLRLTVRREPQALVGSVTVRGRLWNLICAGLAVTLLGAILTYAFVENFRVVPTHVAEARSVAVARSCAAALPLVRAVAYDPAAGGGADRLVWVQTMGCTDP